MLVSDAWLVTHQDQAFLAQPKLSKPKPPNARPVEETLQNNWWIWSPRSLHALNKTSKQPFQTSSGIRKEIAYLSSQWGSQLKEKSYKKM